jgi:hypothetical protein
MYEPHKQSINYFASATASTSDYVAQVNDKTHTFVIGLDQVVIPNKLDFKASSTYTHSTDSQPANFLNAAGQLTGLGPSAATGGQFPDVKTDFQRVEAQAKYKFDDALVQQNGFKGQAFIKLKYAWERNAVTNWQIDSMQDYMYSPTLTTVGYMTWMAYDNPNYNVQMVSASFVLKW